MRVSMSLMRVGILLAAILLWANVQAFAFRTQSIEIPITITGLDDGLSIGTPLKHVKVQLSGKSYSLNQVTEKNLKLGIDLTRVASTFNHKAQVLLLEAPKNVKILSYEPHAIDISLDLVESIQLPVVVDTTGAIADGYALTNLSSDPATVTVSGSPKILSLINEVIGVVQLNHKRSSFFQSVAVLPPMGDLDLVVKINPSFVTASATIEKGTSLRNLGIKPSYSGSLPAGYFVREVKFNPPTIQVSGNQRVLATLLNLESTPINLSNQRKIYTSTVAVNLPRGVKVIGENLIHAEILVELAEASREFAVSPQFVNVTTGFGVVAFNPKTVQLVLLGDETTLRKLNRKDILFNLDLQGVLTGSTEIALTPGMFNLPTGVTVGSFTPDSLEVILARSGE